MKHITFFLLLPLALVIYSCNFKYDYDVIIRNGVIYDGSGGQPFGADIALKGDKIAAIGDLGEVTGATEVDAKGLAVSPGFINMLSWATESLIQDGRSQGDIRQGVTLEVMGEGTSMGPLTEDMKQRMLEDQDLIKYDIAWTTLGEYLQYLEDKGVSTNVASFIGNGTLRRYAVGLEDTEPTAEQLQLMKDLVKQAMEEGAIGISSSLLYVPSIYADTEELTALAKVAAEYNGMYISHIRSEGPKLM
jgi:N-acyl-D-amino-acid deacylase